MRTVQHIPQLKTITDFYEQLQIGQPQSDDFAIMRIEDQPPTKRLEMPLFRCNFYRLVFFTNTGVTFNLPNQHFDIRSNSIYFSYPGKLESWLTTEKISGYLICFTAAFAHADALTATFHQDFPFFDFNSLSLICFSNTAAQSLHQTLENMLTEVQQPQIDSSEMLRYLLYQYLVQVRRLYQQQAENTPTHSQNNSQIFNDFRRVVDDYFIELAAQRADEQIWFTGQ